MNLVKWHELELTREPFGGIMAPMANTPPQSEVEQIAARLRAGRAALGLSQTELCRLSKIAKNTYNQWEQAIGRPQLDQAKLLRRAFGFTLDWIYEGDTSGLPQALALKIMAQEPAKAPRRPTKTKAA